MHHATSLTVYVKSIPHLPHSVVLETSNSERRLLFESGHVFEMFANEFKSVKKHYTKIINKYFGCLGILNLNSPDIVHQYLILIKRAQRIDNIGNTSIFRIYDISTVPLQEERHEHMRLEDIRKLLSNGQFYLSRYADELIETTPNLNNMQTCLTVDITSSLQYRLRTNKSDNRYFWNKLLYLPFVRYNIDMDFWLDKIICGYINIKKVQLHDNFESILCLVSRVATVLPGFKFPMRGLSDSIQTANSVETEQVIYINRSFSSYVILRGCTPLFWDELSDDYGIKKIQLTRGYELTHQTFTKYIEKLSEHYNGDITLLNLLTGTSKDIVEVGGTHAEAFLTNEYLRHYQNLPLRIKEKINFLQYDVIQDGDLSQFSEKIPVIHEFLESDLSREEVFLFHDGDVVSEQKNFIRCNCFDGLNRTNTIQLYIAMYFLNRQLSVVRKEYPEDLNLQIRITEKILSLLKPMWIQNGIELTKFYVNLTTYDFLSDSTGKYDLTDSSTYLATNLLLSSTCANQTAVDRAINIIPSILLTTSSEDVLRQICLRADEYSRHVKLQVGIGTFNASGQCMAHIIQKEHMIQKWLTPLLPTSTRKAHECDIYAIGFQDILDINISPLITTNLVDDNIKSWCSEIEEVLNKMGKYCLITYCQLMGICMFIYIKEKYTSLVKQVNFDSVKIGLGGDKGAVAIRFAFCETTMCFICAHFTEGQSMTPERNKNYQQIMNSLHFTSANSVESHDYVFFLGDLNYRLDLDDSKIRSLIRLKQYDQLLRSDQLLHYKKSNIIFNGFQEGQITFPPTYRYDLNSNSYDTSTDPQSPAWCDRILWKFNPPHKFFRLTKVNNDNISSQSSIYGYPGQSLVYGRIETKISDHRPVFGIIEVGVKRFIPKLFESVYHAIIEENGPLDSTVSLKSASKDKVNIAEPDFVYKVIEKLSTFGQVVMVRFCFNVMFVTFATSWFALSAASVNAINVSGITLTMCIRDPAWQSISLKEIEFCTENSQPLMSTDLMIDKISLRLKNYTMGETSSKMRKRSSISSTRIGLSPKISRQLASRPMLAKNSKASKRLNSVKQVTDTNIIF